MLWKSVCNKIIISGRLPQSNVASSDKMSIGNRWKTKFRENVLNNSFLNNSWAVG